MSKFTTESKVHIEDVYHHHYPNGVRILEVLPEKKYRIALRALLHINDVLDYTGPTEIVHEDQLSDQLIGF